MARTKASRGALPFKLRSPEAPYSFIGSIWKGIKGAVKKTPGEGEDPASAAAEAVATVGSIGDGGGKTASDEKLKAIGEIIASDEDGSGMGLTKRIKKY